MSDQRLERAKRAAQSLTPEELEDLRREITDKLGQRPILEGTQKLTNEDRRADYAMWLKEIFDRKGFAGVLEETYRIYLHDIQIITDYNRLNKYAKQMHKTYHSLFSEAIAADPSRTYLGAVMLTYSPNEKKIYARTVDPQPYPGTREEATAEVFPQLIFAVARVPTPNDIGGQQLSSCISDGQLLLILNELFNPNEDVATFTERRRQKFKEIWAYLERECPGENDRQTVQDIFNKIVKRTKKRLERRIEVSMIDTDDLDVIDRRQEF